MFAAPGASQCTPCAVGQPVSAQGCANADAQLAFAFSISSSGGALLTAASIAASASTLAQISTSFSTLLAVPSASVAVTGVTDIASGATFFFAAAASTHSARLLRSGAGARALAAAGSLGVSVNVSVDLGATPPSATVLAQQRAALAALAVPGTSSAAFFGPIVVKAAAAAGISASAISTSVQASSITTVAAFAVPQPAAASASGGGGGAGPAAGGASGGIRVLVIGVWSFRSYRKHGTCPCFRDRKKEESERKRKAMELAVAELARRQAETGNTAAGNFVVRKVGAAAPAAAAAAEGGFDTVSPLTTAKASFEPKEAAV